MTRFKIQLSPSRLLPLLLLPVLFCFAMNAQAQLSVPFKWIDAKGQVNYSDRPPEANEKVQMVDTTGAGASQVARLPYELEQLSKAKPVIMVASAGCQPCAEGRILLGKRGIPFSEKTVQTEADMKALQTEYGAQTVPILKVGDKVTASYSASGWNAALDAAGYPKTNQLPKGTATGKADKLAQEPVAANTQNGGQNTEGTPGNPQNAGQNSSQNPPRLSNAEAQKRLADIAINPYAKPKTPEIRF